MAYALQPVPPDHQPPKPLVWPAVDDDLLKTLPPVLRGVVTALGFMRARQFLQAHGGVNVSIPRRWTHALGLEVDELMRLREALKLHMDADGRVWMPKSDKLFQRARDTQIRKDRQSNSIAALARIYDLSSKQICNICREDDDQRWQFDLF
jgi:hypothetical protein